MYSIPHITYYAQKRIEGYVLHKLLNPKSEYALKRFGSAYGGYYIPMNLLSSSAICYSGGVGEDVTFDLELIEQTGCEVFTFDPTPRSIKFMTSLTREHPNLHFMPEGLWDKDETLKFFAPQNLDHVSHSVLNIQKTETYFEAPCRSLRSIMKELGHEHIDLLKLNIEGAQYTVIDSVIQEKIPVNIITVSIDQPTSPFRVYRMVKSLQHSGYNLIKIDKWNYTFASIQPTLK